MFGLQTDRKDVLEALHKEEVIEVRQPDTADVSFQETAKNIGQFDKYRQSAEAALSILNEYAPEKTGLFTSRRILPMTQYHTDSAESEKILRAIYDIIGLAEKIQRNRVSIRQIAAKQMALEPYLSLDIPMNRRETERTLIRTGFLSGMWTAERLQGEMEAGGLPLIHFELLGTSREYTYLWLLFPKAHAQETQEFLQAIGFSEPAFSLSHHTPQVKTAVLEEGRRALEAEIRECVEEIRARIGQRHDIELFYDHLLLRRDKYQTLSQIGMLEHVFYLDGYIPKKHGERVKRLIEGNWNTFVELSEPDKPEDVPVAFENNAFAAPVEGITETYSMPSPTDVDPNPVMAFFYYQFFGMMFSDAGYGLLLMLVCGVLGFGKRLEKAKRRSFQMFFYCGVSTVFWGLMYGSFFGNLIYTVSGTFFGREISFDPIWLDPITGAMKLLVFSVAFGMVQILVGLGLSFYSLWRQKLVWDAIFDVGLWMLALVGICLLSAGSLLTVPALASIGTWVAVVAAAGLVLTGGRKSKNIIGKLLSGIVGLYGITGYMSDALSYCRLMALGLATGSISNVVNMLGVMFGGSALGILLFIIVAVFGHSLNFAMNILGAYVHTNRLQYVEFFSKFYEGGGRKFEPFRMRTKYHHFAEE